MTPRRRFLVLAVGAAAMPRFAFAEAGGPAERLTAIVRDPPSAAALGRAYRAQFLREARGEALAAAILATLPPSARTGDEHALRGAIRARVRADFAAGDVVRLDGWTLSRTEGRLAALCA